jgi:hypothetical protein
MQALYKAQLRQTAGSDRPQLQRGVVKQCHTRASHRDQNGETDCIPGSVRSMIYPHLVLPSRAFTYEWCARGCADFDYKANVLQHFRII